MPRPHPVLLRAADEPPAPWEAALPEGVEVLDPSAGERLRTGLREATCLLVDGLHPEALERVLRAHRIEPALQAVMVLPEGERARVERALLFTPGIGEVWLVPPDGVGAGLVGRASDVTRTRKGYRATRARLAQDMAALPETRTRRAVVSDAYLAALLEVSPDPVISVDEQGRVLSWNPGAERVFGYSRAEALGRPLAELLTPAGDGPVEVGALAPTRRELRFKRRDGETGVGELIVLPVEAAGHRVWAVILHDLTAERLALDALEEQTAELELQTQRLQEQAVEMETVNEELARRTEELERAVTSRDRFYAAMSHELRTPINAIVGYNALLLDDLFGPLNETQRHSLGRAQRAARHLMELVNDVLDLAKIEAGRVEIQPERTCFPDVLTELLDTVESLAKQYRSTLAIVGEGSHCLQTDPRRVRQIVLNLLSNAVKFGEGRPVQVRWAALPDGGVEVLVADRGKGIAPEYLGRIFEEFSQVDPQLENGTGLGLSISRRLASLLGGTLSAESEVGRGSTFRVVLPPLSPEGHA